MTLDVLEGYGIDVLNVGRNNIGLTWDSNSPGNGPHEQQVAIEHRGNVRKDGKE